MDDYTRHVSPPDKTKQKISGTWESENFHLKKQVQETAHFIKERVAGLPRIAFLTGTGLGNSISSMEISHTLPYSDIPHFPISTVESHAGQLHFGTLSDVPLMVMQGRFHLYEGYTPLAVTFPIRVMQALNIEILIISNASGGLNLDFSPGDIMVITDHINLTGDNPLIGPNINEWGIRFPDMTQVYDPRLMDLALQCKMTPAHDEDKRPWATTKPDSPAENGQQGLQAPSSEVTVAPEMTMTPKITLRQGIYAGLKGPSLETPAETRYLKTIGADAVGFSTVMEAIAAVHAGMKILGLATITNINNPDAPEKATLEGIIDVADNAAIGLNRLLISLLPQI